MALFLEHPLMTAAICWRLERRDGVVLGFTTHDRDLDIDGLRYRAAPGMLPSSISLTDGFDADALEVKGALSSAAISDRDLRAGRWDGAAVQILMVDWADPMGARQQIARGELGEVSINDNQFEVQIRGPATMLERPVVEQTSPECRADLGDARCRVDMASRTVLTRVSDVRAEDQLEVTATVATGIYDYGRLRWIGGANSGLVSPILSAEGVVIHLREPPPFPARAGDLIELRQGCDKRLATCVSRFANAANFRGEPHLPGLDLLTRYPGA